MAWWLIKHRDDFAFLPLILRYCKHLRLQSVQWWDEKRKTNSEDFEESGHGLVEVPFWFYTGRPEENNGK
jgi:hypothetical protein